MSLDENSLFITYQDFEEVKNQGLNNIPSFITTAINKHKGSDLYNMAITADLYDKQLNKTINEYVKKIFTFTGSEAVDYTASNQKIASNFFHRLNTQRCMYSLGNGISFVGMNDKEGQETTKEKLGIHFDHDIQEAGYYALIHGVSFCFWNLTRLYVFPVTEFVPLWDEYDGSLKAGIRFWQLASNKPLTAVLYEVDGYTKYQTKDGTGSLTLIEDKQAYIKTTQKAPIDHEAEVIAMENYKDFPIVPMWGSKLHQSTLVGLQGAIDSYDLIRSGFANDLSDIAQIYWIIENAGGMTDQDLARFRDRVLLNHIAQADTSQGSKVTPYTQEIPYQARQAFLKEIRDEMYENFGALDVHTVAAGATNDHIDAAYQPMDEEAEDFEYQVTEFIHRLLALLGIEDQPIYKRNRISNQMEQTEMIIAEAQWLDTETILKKLPNITPDEVATILENLQNEDFDRIGTSVSVTEDGTIREETDEEITA